MQNSISVSLEAGAKRVGGLVERSLAGAGRFGGQRCELFVFELFAMCALQRVGEARSGPRVSVGEGGE